MDLGVLQIVPTDFIILFVLWIVFAILALQGGRGEVISITIASFVALFFYEYMTQALWLSDMLSPIFTQPRNAAFLFLSLVVLSYIGIRQLMLPYGSDLIGSPTQSAMLGFLSTIILLAVWIVAPHTEAIWQFGSLFEAFFAPIYTFWWVSIAFALAVVFG